MVAAMQATQFLMYAYPHLTLIGRQQSSPLHVAVLTVDTQCNCCRTAHEQSACNPSRVEDNLQPGDHWCEVSVIQQELCLTMCCFALKLKVVLYKALCVTGTHLFCVFCRKNPNGQSYTSLGVITKGTVIEVNVSELGLVTPGGKVVWGKYAQVTNNPENDGCINAVLLV